MTDDIDVGQGRLGFVGAVLKHFAFLTNAGFKVDALKPTLVTFSSIDCSINIYFGRSSYELGFVLQRAGQEFQLVEFIRLADPQQAKAYQNFQASTAESVAKGVASLAKLVSQFAAPALKADPSIFERLAQ